MNVAHLHCVPFSLAPLGPSGRAHIQKLRPWFEPFFLVSMVLHGSVWSSHSGATGREKRLLHDFWLCSTAAARAKKFDGEALKAEPGDWIWEPGLPVAERGAVVESASSSLTALALIVDGAEAMGVVGVVGV